jgi:DNA modification methylase
MKKLAWQTVSKTVNELIPQEVNPRRISDKQMSDLKKSLKKYNLVEIPVVDLDNKILAGHQRLLALKVLGRSDETIDVRIPNRKLTEQEAKQYLIASNAISGDWDYDLLKSFDFDLLLDSGFEDMELMEFWDQKDEVTNDDFNVENELSKIKKPTTQLGDIITLGKHKILCGDSTSQKNVQRLCGNEKIGMIYSDPVYNISIDYNKGIGGKQNYGGSVNDTRSFDEYKEFITQALKASLSVTAKDAHVFYYCDQIFIGVIQEIYRNLGIDNKRVALWLKNGFSPVPTVAFHKAYEPVVYGIKGRPFLNKVRTKYHEVMNKDIGNGNEMIEQVDHLFDVWTSKRLSSKDYEHATSKPPELHERAILRCTKVNDIIFDSFLGSGSTLIAADQLGRRVYGCELEPTFCDLIIRRYEKLTGIKAQVEHA